MRELIERLERATGPDRELDEAIHAATNKPLRTGLRWGNIPNYTASIDAAVALAERVLPGHRWAVYSNGEGRGPQALLMLNDDPVKGIGRGISPAIALCLAILRAKEDSA